ncbi:Tryptophan synthase beta subunit-like PLP-dependent enzymes superfamily [Penicillium cf. griseofulvum]|uniref:Tryptophan synthase beta subunit-like PLP-dependent enzymes superfamily n=1 Tax=Penicillium cf. griseofulvum TaxID=2972120 RepID=A0A9W9LXW7_9EURO|nr:Tryptophan synthase beta subunit-like PLP-dependent enzymes superfamily [Penicillium cf. griseofulvum]KAJ5451596.1 Tryptophan synthase beta subunit-like PLP-dependent enzymes superfamily [Penicillium cf. griseofulvum]
MSIPFQLPETFAQIPRYKILYPNPSPIHPLSSITRTVSPHHPLITIHAKREDHSSPLACAGNKYRKLEYIVPDILSQTPLYHSHENNPTPRPLQGAVTTLVTEGAIQSNHTVQVAALARTLGLKALILLHRGTGGGLEAASDKEAFQRSGNVQINHLLGAEARICEDDPLAWDATPLLDELRATGENPYWIPGGASLHPLGGLGYARAAFEIAAQEEELGLGGSGMFDYIFVACGSGSTIGGLVAGFKLLEKIRGLDASKTIRGSRKVIGILNSPTKARAYHEARVLAFARRAGELIGLDGERDIGVEDVRLDDRFVGTAYGVLDRESKQALETMARVEGMVLDPVYTAKVARGMMHWVNKGEVADSAKPLEQVNVLFIHTGGQGALGAYADLIKHPWI